MSFGPLRFFTKKELYRLWNEQQEENERMKRELAEFRAIAGYKVETDWSLSPCENMECVACAYSHRFHDRDGGWVLLCLKNYKCENFTPKKAD